MITVTAPMRVSFVGGGTDLPEFSNRWPGLTVSTTVNKHMMLSAINSFYDGIRILWRNGESKAIDIMNLEHDIFRLVLSEYNINNIEISTLSEIPGRGSGMGSSSALTVSAIMACDLISKKYSNDILYKMSVAERAFNIERQIHTLGRQDQYAIAIGGCNTMEYHYDNVTILQRIDMRLVREFFSYLSFIWLGERGKRHNILKDVSSSVEYLRPLVNMATTFAAKLSNRQYVDCCKIISESWKIKQAGSSKISNDLIDNLLSDMVDLGAYGGKILGAGSAGVLMVTHPPDIRLKIKDTIENNWENLRILSLSPVPQGATAHLDRE